MHVHRCGGRGVYARGTKGRLTDCQVSECYRSGIVTVLSYIEIDGLSTKITQNVTSKLKNEYGLNAIQSSNIHLLTQLTKDSISVNNWNEQNYSSENHTCNPKHERIRTVEPYSSLFFVRKSDAAEQLLLTGPPSLPLLTAAESAVATAPAAESVPTSTPASTSTTARFVSKFW
jgi:hypothetical protein